MQSQLFNQGMEALKAGRFTEAKKHFADHEQASGTALKTQANLKLADEKFVSGDMLSASKMYEAVVDVNPSLAGPYIGLARLGLLTGQLTDAETHAKAATRVAPENPMSWVVMGLVFETKGNEKSALTAYEKSAELGPNEYLAHYNYGRLLFASQKTKAAIPSLIRATDIQPTSADALIALGLAYRANHDVKNWIGALEKAKDVAPTNVDAWATLADGLFELKQYATAEFILAAALENVGDHPALLEKAIATAFAQSKNERALVLAEREVVVAPTHAPAWINVAMLSAQFAKYDRAEAAAKEAIRLDAKAAEGFHILGNIYDVAKQDDKAIHAYQQCIAIAPSHWKARMNLAIAHLQSNDKAQWILAKEQLLALVAPPGEFRPTYNLALAHVRLGEKESAKLLAQKIVREASDTDPIATEAKKLELNLS